jgi:hypothetical protein
LPSLDWAAASVTAASSRSLTATIPAAWQPGVYALRLRNGAEIGPTRLVNAPQAWFTEGDQGDSASPGGLLTVAGTNLVIPGATPQAVLVQGGAVAAHLTLAAARASGGYALDWTIPQGTAPGVYELWLHNGRGGPGAWVRYSSFDTKPVTSVTIASPVVWPSAIVDVSKQAGATDDERFTAAIATLKTGGGGVLRVPAGTYHLNRQLMLPAHTILRGDGMTKTTLGWDSSPSQEYNGQKMMWVDAGYHVPLVRSWFVTWGSPPRENFAVEDLAIQGPAGYGSDGSSNAQGICRQSVSEFGWIRRVRVSLPRIPTTATGGPLLPAIFLRQARNTEISGSTLEANTGIFERDNVSFTRVEGTTLRWSQNVVWWSAGATASVFSNNTIEQVGDSISNGWSLVPNPNPGVTYSAFYASDSCPPYTKDTLLSGTLTKRQAAETPPGYIGYTSDGGDGVYLGGVAAVDGAQVTLAAPSTGKFQFAGGVVEVLEGAGAGQWRAVAALPAGSTSLTVDRPFDVPLDATSVLTIVNTQGRLLMVDNDFSQFPLIQDYFLAIDSIKANNTLGVVGQSSTLINWTGQHYSGALPAWHTQVLGNHETPGVTLQYNSSMQVAVPGYAGVIGAAHVFRGAVSGKASLRVGSKVGPFADVLAERNQVDTILFNANNTPYDLRGVAVVRQNVAPGGGPSVVQPAAPVGVTLAP